MESAISIMQFLQPEQVAVSPESRLLEADKSTGQMIWTNIDRLEGGGTWRCGHQTCKQIDDKHIATCWAILAISLYRQQWLLADANSFSLIAAR